MKKFLMLLAVLLFALNVPPIKYITGPDDMLYSNANGSFTFDEANFTGRNYDLCLRNFNAFKSVNKKDTILYRLEGINIAKVWRWGDYLTKEKYRLPFKSWKDIDGLRGPIVNRTAWQAF